MQSTGTNPRSMKWISTGTDSSGWIAMTRTPAFSPSCGARRTPKISLSWSQMPRLSFGKTYRVGVPEPGFYREIMNTDAEKYWRDQCGQSWWRSCRSHPLGQPRAIPLTCGCRPWPLLLQTRTLVVRSARFTAFNKAPQFFVIPSEARNLSFF